MKKRIIPALLAVVLLISAILAIALPASAASNYIVESDSDWLAAPSKALVKCPGGDCDHTQCDYAYSFAVVGDTQNLNILDCKNGTEHMKTLYSWIVNNKESKNIKYVLGLGDITQAYHRDYQTWVGGKKVNIIQPEWDNAAEAIALLDNVIPYSLVRGNHDVSYYLNDKFGKGSLGEDGVSYTGTAYYNALKALCNTNDEEGRPMAGFLDENKIEDTYRKVIIGDHKYIIFTLDWHQTEECITWLNDTLTANSDYRAIITVHEFVTRDGSITDDPESTFPYENRTGSRPAWEEVSSSGGNVFPRVLWENALSKHANVEMLLCGHVDEDDIITTQMRGENGNAVTCMLIDAQTVDTPRAAGTNSASDPGFEGNVGMVAMLYVSADGNIANVEYISTVRAAANKNAYLREKNQFEVDLSTGFTETKYGYVPTVEYNANTFHVLLDDDGISTNENIHYGSYATWDEALKGIHAINGIGGAAVRKEKTYYIVMSKDYTFNTSGLSHNQAGKCLSHTVFDLQGHTLTINSGKVLLPIYNQSTSYNSHFTIANGDVLLKGSAKLIVTQHGHVNANNSIIDIDLTDLNIIYASDATQPIVSSYDGAKEGPSNVNLNVTDCSIDASAAKLPAIFALRDNKNNVHTDLNIKGGSIKGSTLANTPIFTLNHTCDRITFSANATGEYTTVTLADNQAINEIVYKDTDEAAYGLGSPVAVDGGYLYSLVTTTDVLTPYGVIPSGKAGDAFALFKNGKCLLTSSDWNALINTNFKSTANYQSGCTLLLTKNYVTGTDSTASPSWFFRIDDLTIDLGGHVFSRGSLHMFQFMGTEATAHETNIVIKNGTIKTASGTAPIVFNNADSNTAADTLNLTLEGITCDISDATGSQGVLVAFGDGLYQGITANVTLNDCEIYRGDSTKTVTLFGLIDEKSGKVNNKTDITVNINGGKLVADSMANLTFASFSPVREGMTESADKIFLGKGSDGNDFVIELPAGYTIPETTYAFTGVNYALLKTSSDATKAIYTMINESELDKLNTEYGTISTDYFNEETYPIVLFNKDTKECIGGYGDIANAFNKIMADPDGNYVILVRRDCEKVAKKYIDATFTGSMEIDLGGHTLTVTEAGNYLIDLGASDATGPSATFTIKNGTLVKAGGRGFVDVNYNANLQEKNANYTFNFTDVTFRSTDNTYNENVVFVTWENGFDGATAQINVTSVFTDCVFDFAGSIEGAVMLALNHSEGVKDRVVHNVTINGGEVLASAAADFTDDFVRLDGDTNGRADSITFSKTETGDYTKLTLPAGVAAPTGEYNGLIFGDGVTNADGTVSYVLVIKPLGPEGGTPDLPVYTQYGEIPAEYTDASKYPIIIFKNGVYFGNATAFATEAHTKALAETKGSADDIVVVLFRQSLSETLTGALSYFDQVKGTLIIDLGGNTYTANAKNLFQFNAKNSTNNPKIEVRNGRLNTTRLIGFATQNTAACQEYDILFSNVTFGFAQTKWSEFIDTNVGATWAHGYSHADLTFEDCIFDLRDYTTTYKFLDLASDDDSHAIDVVFKGGEIIFGNYSFTFATVKSGYSDNALFPGGDRSDSDTVRFEKGANGYTVFRVPVGRPAPTDVYNSTELTFVKIGENATELTYRLMPKAAADQSFVPKASITLGSELTFNIYVPANKNLTALTLNGENIDLSALTAEDGYYLISEALGAREAAKTLTLVATLTVDGKVMRGSFTFSIPKYAEKLLTDVSASAEEKALVKDVLSYIKAAYAYFGTTDAEALAKIDELLGENYDESSAPVMNGSAEKPTLGITTVTYDLTAKPALRFYLAEGFKASDFVFSIKGNTVSAEEGSDANGKYVEVKLYAYELAETVDYTVNGESDSCHIQCYYEWAKTQNNDNLVKLVERFAKYCESAKAYRESVIN